MQQAGSSYPILFLLLPISISDDPQRASSQIISVFLAEGAVPSLGGLECVGVGALLPLTSALLPEEASSSILPLSWTLLSLQAGPAFRPSSLHAFSAPALLICKVASMGFSEPN